MRGGRKEEGGRRKEERGKRKEERGKRKEETYNKGIRIIQLIRCQNPAFTSKVRRPTNQKNTKIFS